MAGLRIERHSHEVAFLWYVGGHLPRFSADRSSPINFFRFIVAGDASDQFLEAMFSAHTPHRSNDDDAIPCAHLNIVTKREMRFLKNMLGKAKSLAITPSLDLGHHNRSSLGYTLYSH